MKDNFYNWMTWWSDYILTYELASDERIACQSWWTAAYWIVTDYLALSSQTTCPRAGIYTFLIWTGLIKTAIRADNAFWSARWRAAYETLYTWAYSLFIDDSALTVGATGRRTTWLFHLRSWNSSKKEKIRFILNHFRMYGCPFTEKFVTIQFLKQNWCLLKMLSKMLELSMWNWNNVLITT